MAEDDVNARRRELWALPTPEIKAMLRDKVHFEDTWTKQRLVSAVIEMERNTALSEATDAATGEGDPTDPYSNAAASLVADQIIQAVGDREVLKLVQDALGITAIKQDIDELRRVGIGGVRALERQVDDIRAQLNQRDTLAGAIGGKGLPGKTSELPGMNAQPKVSAINPSGN